MGIVLVWLALAVLVAFFADSRGRSGFGFFLVSVLLSPIIGFVIVLVMPDLHKVAAETAAKKAADERHEQLRREEHERQLEAIRAISEARPSVPSDSSVSVADELVKLAKLRADGVLTEEEFQRQKSVILAT